MVHLAIFTTFDISETVSGFTEVVGNWEIVEDPEDEEETVLSGPGGGVLISDTPIPDSPPDDVNMIVSATFRITDGIKPRVYVNWLSVTEHYYAEWDRDGEAMVIFDAADVELARVNVPVPFNDTAEFTVCMTRFGTLTADFDNQITYACVSPFPGGDKGGIGNGSGAVAYWESFSLVKHYWSQENCPLCLCTCAGSCVPRILTLTLVACDEFGCLDLDGVTIELEVLEIDSIDHRIIWRFNEGVGLWPCGVCRADWSLHCSFEPGDPTNFFGWRLFSATPDVICSPGPELGTTPDEDSTCDPLNLIFRDLLWSEEGDPFTCCTDPESDGVCTDAYITEP